MTISNNIFRNNYKPQINSRWFIFWSRNNFDFPDTVNKILSFGKANISNITSAIDTSMDLGIRQVAYKQNKEKIVNLKRVIIGAKVNLRA